MRADLDATFKDAHAQVAAVIRGLQRAGDGTARETAQGAAHARDRLLSLEDSTQEPSREAEDAKHAEELGNAVDWRRAKPGDPVIVPGGREGVLEALPDRRGRVRVRVASAKLEIDGSKVRLPGKATSETNKSTAGSQRVHFERAEPESEEGGTRECDLRGMRVDEALDVLVQVLDDGLRDGDDFLQIIHGMGTGALRSAVRENLAASPHVVTHRAGERGEGGEGVTIATLRR
jgi:DNA mismatch repair protein MutS2